MKRSKLAYLIVLWLGLGLIKSPIWLRNIFIFIIFFFLLITPNVYRARIRRSLKIFFPAMSPAKRLTLVNRSMLAALFISSDIITMWFRGKEWAKGRINKMHNLEIANKALNTNEGVVFISPHLGNWELLATYLGEHKSMNLYKAIQNPYYMEACYNYRTSCGMDTMSVDKAISIRKIIQRLRSGGTLAIMPDQRPQAGSGSIVSKFYEVNILSASLFAKIIHSSKAKVVFSYAIRGPKGKYDIFFKEPDPDVYSSDTKISVHAINKTIEKCIGDNIAQYNWLQSKTIK